MFVQRSILREFTEHLLEATQKLKIGDPFNEATTVGATITPEHAQKVLNYIESAKQEVTHTFTHSKFFYFEVNITINY